MSSTNQFITVRETAQLMGITEKKVMDLIEQRQLQAYRIADKFLRLKKSEVMSLRHKGDIAADSAPLGYSQTERVQDFFYFNDFYIYSGVIIIFLLYVIFFT